MPDTSSIDTATQHLSATTVAESKITLCNSLVNSLREALADKDKVRAQALLHLLGLCVEDI